MVRVNRIVNIFFLFIIPPVRFGRIFLNYVNQAIRQFKPSAQLVIVFYQSRIVESQYAKRRIFFVFLKIIL